MDKIKIQAEGIDYVHYDASKQILNIELESGDIYRYNEVPQLVYQGLLNSATPSQYMDTYLNKHFIRSMAPNISNN